MGEYSTFYKAKNGKKKVVKRAGGQVPCRCSNCCHQAPDDSHLLVELKFASTLPHFTLTFKERCDSVETQNL